VDGRVAQANGIGAEIMSGLALALEVREVDFDGRHHFIDLGPFLGARFLVNEVEHSLGDGRDSIIVTKVTPDHEMEAEKQVMTGQIGTMFEQFISNGLQAGEESSQTIFGEIALVDRHLKPGNSVYMYDEFMGDSREYITEFTKCTFFSLNRWNLLFLMETESSERGKVNQVMREILRFIETGRSKVGEQSTMSISKGKKVVLQTNHSDPSQFTMYYQVFMNGAALMKFRDFGPIVCDIAISGDLETSILAPDWSNHRDGKRKSTFMVRRRISHESYTLTVMARNLRMVHSLRQG
jgi:hypothetical protein